jgi:hypothetical protein
MRGLRACELSNLTSTHLDEKVHVSVRKISAASLPGLGAPARESGRILESECTPPSCACTFPSGSSVT